MTVHCLLDLIYTVTKVYFKHAYKASVALLLDNSTTHPYLENRGGYMPACFLVPFSSFCCLIWFVCSDYVFVCVVMHVVFLLLVRLMTINWSDFFVWYHNKQAQNHWSFYLAITISIVVRYHYIVWNIPANGPERELYNCKTHAYKNQTSGIHVMLQILNGHTCKLHAVVLVLIICWYKPTKIQQLKLNCGFKLDNMKGCISYQLCPNRSQENLSRCWNFHSKF